jgi:hypothetical protein
VDRVLITGAAGTIGRILREGLHGRVGALRLLDVAPLGAPWPGEELVTADIRDREAVTEAMEGVDATVHLAGIPTRISSTASCRPTSSAPTTSTRPPARRAAHGWCSPAASTSLAFMTPASASARAAGPTRQLLWGQQGLGGKPGPPVYRQA